MTKLKFLYVSRNQNRLGYTILLSLLKNGLFPAGVLLPTPTLLSESRAGLYLHKGIYWTQTIIENSRPLRFLESEFLLAKKASIPIFRSSPLITDEALLEKMYNSNYDLIFLGGGWPGRLSRDFIKLGRLGTLNTHPSLLPSFRGTSITRWQVLEGVSESGVTIHTVNDDFDAGPIVAQASTKTLINETPQELHQRLSYLGATLATQLLVGVKRNGLLPEVVQQSFLGRYYPSWNWSSANLKIDFSKPLKFIHQFVLANTQECYKYAGPGIRFNDREFYIRETEITSSNAQEMPNIPHDTLLHSFVNREGFIVIIKHGDPDALLIKKIQVSGKTRGINRAARPGIFFSINARINING